MDQLLARSRVINIYSENSTNRVASFNFLMPDCRTLKFESDWTISQLGFNFSETVSEGRVCKMSMFSKIDSTLLKEQRDDELEIEGSIDAAEMDLLCAQPSCSLHIALLGVDSNELISLIGLKPRRSNSRARVIHIAQSRNSDIAVHMQIVQGAA